MIYGYATNMKLFFYLLFSFRTREISQIMTFAKWGESAGNWLKANHLFSFLFWPFGDTLGWSYTINIDKENPYINFVAFHLNSFKFINILYIYCVRT